MARIRTIKPEFYRHEELQDLEIKHPHLRPMLVFSALWGHCDKNGVFEWKPRQMQLDIIPFIWEATGKQLVDSLMLLVSHHFIKTLTDGNKAYGFISSFKDHQRVNGKEAQAGALHPCPENMTGVFFDAKGKIPPGKQPGSTGEATETTGREGKGIGKEGNKEVSTFYPEALRLSGLLADNILINVPAYRELQPGKRETTVERWAQDIDKLARIDNQSIPDIEATILWCQKDDFWKDNILSGSKLREKWDKLQIKMKATTKSQGGLSDDYKKRFLDGD